MSAGKKPSFSILRISPTSTSRHRTGTNPDPFNLKTLLLLTVGERKGKNFTIQKNQKERGGSSSYFPSPFCGVAEKKKK